MSYYDSSLSTYQVRVKFIYIVFFILFILGVTNTITPIKTTSIMAIDTTIMLFVTILTIILAYDKKDFNRKDGIILVATFIIYMIYIIIRN